MPVQAILFNKDSWTEDSAENYLFRHKFHPIKPVHKTTNFLRYRLRLPRSDTKYFTKKLNNDVLLIIEL